MSNTKYVLRAVLLALASSVLVFLLVGMVLADRWQVTTTRTISAPLATIAGKLVDLRQWQNWSEVDFELGNPTTRDFEGEAGKADQAGTWRGPMGIATVLLTRVEDGSSEGAVEYAIGYKYGPDGDSFGGKFTGSIVWQVKGDAVEVTWTEDGVLANLMQRWSNWFGALQVKVGQVQRSSLAGLEERIRREADELGKTTGAVFPKTGSGTTVPPK
ncbi:MAG: hypothetical protein ACI89X_000910 [Planctomycetota bacterium]|jgi:hypothetical protein